MAQVLLFMRDFEFGTRISDILIRQDRSIEFMEDLKQWPEAVKPETDLCIVDLDDPDFGSVHTISLIRAGNPQLSIIGYMKTMVKESREKLKAAGCNLILTRSSLAKNIPTLLKNL